jgi:hypothetical protein
LAAMHLWPLVAARPGEASGPGHPAGRVSKMRAYREIRRLGIIHLQG